MFKTLREKGAIIPNNTHGTHQFILSKKAPPSQGWTMLQDSQAVNQAGRPRAPMVPDPSTLLNEIPKNTTHFSVIGLANAFCTECKFWV